jgi:hypothetical protein
VFVYFRAMLRYSGEAEDGIENGFSSYWNRREMA